MLKHNDNLQKCQDISRELMMSSPEMALQLIEQNKNSDFYRDDFEFRIKTEIQHMTCDNFLQNYDAVLERGSAVLNQLAISEKPHLLAEACSVLGVAFLEMDMVDEVVHSYNNVIAIEEENGRTHLTSVAYNNIGVMYYYVEEHEKAIEMFNKAYNNMLSGAEGNKNALSVELHILASLVICYSQLKDFDQAEKALNAMQELETRATESITLRMIDCAYMAYYMNRADYQAGRRYYDKLTSPEVYARDPYFVVRLTNAYCNICRKDNLPYTDYIDVVLPLGNIDLKKGNLYEIIKLQLFLIDYYESIEDTKSALMCYRKLKKHTERSLFFTNRMRLKAIKVRQDLERTREESASHNQKNKELSMIAQEALSMRNKLQEAYNQINMISMLGSKLTTATTFSDLKNVAYNIICDKMHVSSFTILAVSDDKKALESMAKNVNGQPVIHIDLRDVSSLFVESYLQNRIIVCSDVTDSVRQTDAMFVGDHAIESIVFMPLSYESKVIGVLSVQSIHKNAYDDDKVEFLKLISSYLSIALNNVKKSRVLVEEINLHKQTQQELEKVNLYLKNLSSLDGLTKVNNRRAFDEAYSKLVAKATSKNQPVTVIMIDIDFFKRFNDRYGHLKGDEALVKVAQKINQAFLNDKSTFARFGGEEFIAVTVGYADEAITNLCEQIRLSIANMLIENENTDSGYLTVSIGAAQMAKVSSDAKSRLMRKADEMLYKAKDDGRNRSEVCFIS